MGAKKSQKKITSLRQFAKMVGVSHTAIEKAIKAGRIPKAAVYRDAAGKHKIYDVALAKKSFAANSDPAKVKVKPEPEAEEPPVDKAQAETYNKSRTIKEVYGARKAKLEYETMAGELVEKRKVKMEAFNVARKVRDAMLNIPSRMSAQLAAETDPHKVHTILEQEIVQALEELAREEMMAANQKKDEEENAS